MSAVVVGPEEIAALKKLVEVAEANIITHEEIRVSAATGVPPPQCFVQRVTIPVDYTVTLTIEAQATGLILRHMSMVGSQPRRVPRPEAVEMVFHDLGFVRTLADCTHDTYELDNGAVAIHLWQPDEKLSSLEALDKIGWKRAS